MALIYYEIKDVSIGKKNILEYKWQKKIRHGHTKSSQMLYPFKESKTWEIWGFYQDHNKSLSL